MTALEIYCLNVFSGLGEVCIILGLLSLVGSIVAYVISHIERAEQFYKLINRIFVTACILLCLGVLIPDKRTIVAMLVVPNITKQSWIKELPDNMQKIVNKLIIDYLGEDKK